jgi:hypothetical protein
MAIATFETLPGFLVLLFNWTDLGAAGTQPGLKSLPKR